MSIVLELIIIVKDLNVGRTCMFCSSKISFRMYLCIYIPACFVCACFIKNYLYAP